MKSFIRSRSGTNTDANKLAITKAVQRLIKDLMAAWVTDDNFLNYICSCPDGTHDFSCCVLDSACTPTEPCDCGSGLPKSFVCCGGCDVTSLLPSNLQVRYSSFIGTIS